MKMNNFIISREIPKVDVPTYGQVGAKMCNKSGHISIFVINNLNFGLRDKLVIN